jgi:hypothetical protein
MCQLKVGSSRPWRPGMLAVILRNVDVSRGSLMRLARICNSLSLIALLVSGPLAHCQANIVENQTTLLYVDARIGSDSNSGTSSSPLRSIQAAVNKANANNQKKIGTKVIVDAGVYRETVNINPVSNQSAVPLTIQAAITGTAVISGSNVLNNWSSDPTYSSAYLTSWSPTAGTCAMPSGWPTGIPRSPCTQR